jgi:hypothetical protein
MTILQKILRLLTPLTDQKRAEVKADRAERTEKTIERYGAQLNTTAADRRGRPHTLGR